MMGVEKAGKVEDAWLDRLRERFLEIAGRRVEADVMEDVVQEALSVIHAKRNLNRRMAAGELETPPLAWCFQVLRNVIGNHYQKNRSRDRVLVRVAADAPARDLSPLESLERAEIVVLLRDSIEELARTDGMCGDLLREMLHEKGSHLRTGEGARESTFYVRAFRCRQKLRGILLRRGYS